ncbi:MAG TPA: ATP synthase F1 subunit epsilon [Thermoanaerobaculia bacterium]|nr:ATP synthase F1 subunit epsilon [Thermoanaerobaculia bacterium]
MAKTFALSVITPERAALETNASFVALPAYDGEIGILAGRAPLLVKLGAGWLRVDTETGKEALLVNGGFAQVAAGKVTVLTEQARTKEEIDPEKAQAALTAAHALPSGDDTARDVKERAVKYAKEMGKVARAG